MYKDRPRMVFLRRDDALQSWRSWNIVDIPSTKSVSRESEKSGTGTQRAYPEYYQNPST